MVNAPTLPTPPPTTGSWSSASVHASDRTDGWRSALAENFCTWQLDSAVSADFDARIRHRDLGGLRVVDSHCDPCSGGRTRADGGRAEDRYFGVQIAKAGRKRLEIDGVRFEVGPGDMVFWTSERPVTFAVTERMHKVSLLVPCSEISERLPEWRNFKSAVVQGQRGIGAVLAAQVEALAVQMDDLEPEDAAAARRATVELLIAALSRQVDNPPRAVAHRYLEKLQAYVLANLQDENLSPATIAQAHRMSARYVHLLFARLDLSVSHWIRMQRLERCREALESTAHRHESVSEIAYRWGFRDPLHFSRLFKKHYGVSPTLHRMKQAG